MISFSNLPLFIQQQICNWYGKRLRGHFTETPAFKGNSKVVPLPIPADQEMEGYELITLSSNPNKEELLIVISYRDHGDTMHTEEMVFP